MQTLDQVVDAALHIKLLLDEPRASFGGIYLDLTDQGQDITPEDYLALYLVAVGLSIPEAVLLRAEYPAIEHLRTLSLADQEKYITREEPLNLAITLRNGNYVTQKRTYKQLGEKDCWTLFDQHRAESSRMKVHCLKHHDRSLLCALEY
ncbi:MAG: hypothetical protein WCJ14_05180 [Verrucomicrobiota bacterium]